MSDTALHLDGKTLDPLALSRAALGAPRISMDVSALAAMSASNDLVYQAIHNKTPVYGVTTGLGSRATEVLDEQALSEFSMQTLRGRAHAIGPPETREIIRAGMIVRLNTLLCGYSGARPELALHIAKCLESDLTPVCGQIGSIGAADLVLNATIGLALVGEGQMQDGNGDTGPSAEMMQTHGIPAFVLAPREGLALANHTGSVGGAAALALHNAQVAFEAAQSAAALSMEGFRANLGPLDAAILAVKPYPGQLQAAEGLRKRLAGSDLNDTSNARRLQDPLSIRNIVQIHGTTQAALAGAMECILIEINSASDNPIALVEEGKIISSGAYFTAEITSVAETLSRSIVQLAFGQLARISKLLNPVFSDLPNFLAMPNSSSNGFAPVMKVAEAVMAELAHSAQPVQTWPSVNANGVEDCMPNSPTAVKALVKVTEMLRRLTAIELLVAAQAADFRKGCHTMAPFSGNIVHMVRRISPSLTEDRPMGDEIEALAEHISRDGFKYDQTNN